MASVTIGGKEYATYADVEMANAYLLASLNADTWSAADTGRKSIYLLEATRLIDRQTFRPGFELFAQRAATTRIVEASIEIAAVLSGGDTDIMTTMSTAPDVKRIKAGSVEIENYDRAGGTRFAGAIQELLAPFLATATTGRRLPTIGGAASFGTDTLSTREQEFGLARPL